MVAEDRTPEVSAEMIRQVALRLFVEHGFADTSMVQIAQAAGVDQKLVYRYFPTKADMIWRGYDETYDALVTTLRKHRGTGRVGDAVRAAVCGVLRYEAAQNDEIAAHIETVDRNPALYAESEDRIAAHKQAIIAFVADETGQEPSDLVPRLVGETVVVATIVTTRYWSSLGDPRLSLGDQVDAAVAPLLEGFAGLLERRSAAAPTGER